MLSPADSRVRDFRLDAKRRGESDKSMSMVSLCSCVAEENH